MKKGEASQEMKSKGEKKAWSRNRSSAFDPKGHNDNIYNPNSFDTQMLKSYSSQISDLAQKAYSLHKKKMHMKSVITQLREKLDRGIISKQYFDKETSHFLKGYDEYKVYEMYDEYISYMINQMKQYTEGIFGYIDTHKYDIPVISKSEEETDLERDIVREDNKRRKEQEEKEKTEGWKSSADTFETKEGNVEKKEGLMDKIAKSIYSSIIPEKNNDPFSPDEVKEKEGFAQFWDWFIGKSKKSPFGSDTKNSLKKKESALDRFVKEEKKKEKGILGGRTAFSERYKNIRRIHLESEDELETPKNDSKSDVKDFIDQIDADKKKNKVAYKPSSYNALANILMRNISIEVINSFPAFFKNLYKNMRFANMHILSHTYTNTMILTSILVGVGVLILTGFASFVMFVPIPMVIANSFLAGMLALSSTFIGFSLYPRYKMRTRERSIETNLPFAIDHMAAVTSAGVNPTAMFTLLSQSDEYGDVSLELEKIVEYIQLFGYDITTAVEKVSMVTPSRQMKEFLEGFISTVESGGELKNYLRESADQAMLHYKLERQKYTQNISTFSDIYTGLMVASPLFFVAALSMISILGGTIGNMDVNTLMMLGTYLVIPGLNVIFIVMMEITQPSI